jgi:hypothetical protein
MNKIISILIIIILVIFSVIAIIFLGPIYHSNDTSENTLTAIIESDKTIARVDEGFNFTAENSLGQIVNYLWDFGDGNNSKGLNVKHSYKIAGWYNVTLNIDDGSGNSANSTIVIGIQQNDISLDIESGRNRELRLFTWVGNGIIAGIGPNIGQPAIEVSGIIHQAVGNFVFQIEIRVELPNDDFYSETIHEETLFGNGGNIQFGCIVQPSDLHENVQKYPARIQSSMMITQGRWGSIEMYLNAVFPMEGLTTDK